ncbi:hypothetical protein NE237_027635 [Protea cynaroides]|uniref:Uncharacterized protein n=1 Tax=Protea cynaroides TaxID=273540 RepID=A0A9Q0GNC3_9MAGN|nr:hypothetical protein NE237_027635 [Protea cynaroides]
MQSWIIKQLWQEKQLYCYACHDGHNVVSLCSIIFHISDPWHSNHLINFLELKLDVCDPTEVFAPANGFQLVLCEIRLCHWKCLFWRIRYWAASFFSSNQGGLCYLSGFKANHQSTKELSLV